MSSGNSLCGRDSGQFSSGPCFPSRSSQWHFPSGSSYRRTQRFSLERPHTGAAAQMVGFAEAFTHQLGLLRHELLSKAYHFFSLRILRSVLATQSRLKTSSRPPIFPSNLALASADL